MENKQDMKERRKKLNAQENVCCPAVYDENINFACCTLFMHRS